MAENNSNVHAEFLALTKTNGEPLYNVLNECDKLLLSGVTHTQACRAIDAHQADPGVPAQWQGAMRIRSQRMSVRQPAPALRLIAGSAA